MPLTNAKYRKLYTGTLIAAGGFTPATAAAAVRHGIYDLIAFGRCGLRPCLPVCRRFGGHALVLWCATVTMEAVVPSNSTGLVPAAVAPGRPCSLAQLYYPPRFDLWLINFCEHACFFGSVFFGLVGLGWVTNVPSSATIKNLRLRRWFIANPDLPERRAASTAFQPRFSRCVGVIPP